MADVGPLLARNDAAIPTAGGASPSYIAADYVIPHQTGYKWFTSAVNGIVSGILKELGVVKAGCKLRLYDEVTGDYLNCTVSAGDGSFSMSALGRSKVYVVAFDSPYNSLIFDNVTPV